MQLQSNFVDVSFNLSCLLVRFSCLVLNLDFIMNNLFCYQSEKPNYNKSDAKSLPKINIIKPFFSFSICNNWLDQSYRFISFTVQFILSIQIHDFCYYWSIHLYNKIYCGVENSDLDPGGIHSVPENLIPIDIRTNGKWNLSFFSYKKVAMRNCTPRLEFVV